MIYGKDVALEYPTKDLYDSDIMLQAINAARYDFETGREQMKEFNKLYGDFMSPIQSDVDFWNRSTILPVRDALNAMYQQGIDPTRSAEGRALIALIINNVPVAELNQRRYSAEAAKEYLKNRAALLRAGKYNPEYEAFTLGGKSLETWDTNTDGLWTRTSPMEYQTLHDFVDPSLDNIKPYNLSKDEVEGEFGRTYDPRYQYLGVAPSRLEQSLRTNIPGLAANPLYDFYKDLARRDWMREHPGETPTEDQVLDRFVKNAIVADYERVVNPVWDEDKFALEEQQYQNQAKLKAQDFRYDVALLAMKNANDGSRKSSKSGGGSGDEDYDELSLGAFTQLATEQNIKYQSNKNQFANKFEKDELDKQVHLFNKMNKDDKRIANSYAANYRILNDPNASAKRKKEAQEYIKKCDRKRSKQFVDWKKQYLYRQNGLQAAWNSQNTTEGRAFGITLDIKDLRRNSWDIFNKNNIVRGFNSDLLGDINTLLNYKKSETVKGGETGTMNLDRDFADIVIANMTGNRTYRWNLIPRFISRLIKGKSYNITPQNQANRTYGSGIYKKKNVNVIVEDALFTNNDVVNAIENSGYSQQELEDFGIRKTEYGYIIPIASTYGHGQGAAEVDIKSRKRRSNEGLSAAEQAKEFTFQQLGI